MEGIIKLAALLVACAVMIGAGTSDRPDGNPQEDQSYLTGGWPILTSSTYIAQAQG